MSNDADYNSEKLSMQQYIEKIMQQIANENSKKLDLSEGGQALLLDCGLDSLDFAIIVATLEDQIGVDPFADMTEAYYPTTLDEFVHVYEQAIGSTS